MIFTSRCWFVIAATTLLACAAWGEECVESSASKIAANDDDDIRELDVTTLRRRACSSNGFPVDVCLEGVPPKGASWMNCEDVVFYDEISMVDGRLEKYRLKWPTPGKSTQCSQILLRYWYPW